MLGEMWHVAPLSKIKGESRKLLKGEMGEEEAAGAAEKAIESLCIGGSSASARQTR
jgi:hypothetical protein